MRESWRGTLHEVGGHHGYHCGRLPGADPFGVFQSHISWRERDDSGWSGAVPPHRGSARARGLPISFLTRLIWQESSFRATAVSPVGAQGIAQFMPGTAQERGLLDPFDPEQAIPAAASLLHDLSLRFGNLGLAAAAYNAGPNRVSAWLERRGGLPAETRDYVIRITGRSAEDWAAETKRRISSSHRFHHKPQNPVFSSQRTRCSPREVISEASARSVGRSAGRQFFKRDCACYFRSSAAGLCRGSR